MDNCYLARVLFPKHLLRFQKRKYRDNLLPTDGQPIALFTVCAAGTRSKRYQSAGREALLEPITILKTVLAAKTCKEIVLVAFSI